MRQKKSFSLMVLKKQTIANLSIYEAARVQGGATEPEICNVDTETQATSEEATCKVAGDPHELGGGFRDPS